MFSVKESSALGLLGNVRWCHEDRRFSKRQEERNTRLCNEQSDLLWGKMGRSLLAQSRTPINTAYRRLGGNMQIGDLVDDGFGCFGVITALGWIFPESVSGSASSNNYSD